MTNVGTMMPQTLPSGCRDRIGDGVRVTVTVSVRLKVL